MEPTDVNEASDTTADETDAGELVEEELLVEEISIDGMCGVYFSPVAFDPDLAYRLHDRVALRPEPFGALAYHYGNRRLNFLRAPELVSLVESLGDHGSARAAFDSAGIETRRWPSFEKALASLAASDFLVPA